MKTARIFTNGRSQAVRLPKEYRFKGKDVYIRRLDHIVVLIPKDAPWASLVRSLDRFSDDFMETREQPASTRREGL
jgi:antitoxin VapB